MQRRRTRRRPQGFTLVEVMVVLVILSALASAVGFAVVANLKRSREKDAGMRARTIQSAAVAYLMDHPGACPTVDDMLEDDILDRTTNAKDPWDHAYAIECDGSAVHVHSSGDDEQAGTADDIGF